MGKRGKRGRLHDEPCKAWARLPKGDVIFAVVPKARHVFSFNTGVQSFVEDFMHDVGHAPDYYLCSRGYKGLLLPMGARLAENRGKNWSWKRLDKSWTVTTVNVRIFAGTIPYRATKFDPKRGSEWTCIGHQCEFERRDYGRRR
jgi:hypothetical protein